MASRITVYPSRALCLHKQEHVFVFPLLSLIHSTGTYYLCAFLSTSCCCRHCQMGSLGPFSCIHVSSQLGCIPGCGVLSGSSQVLNECRWHHSALRVPVCSVFLPSLRHWQTVNFFQFTEWSFLVYLFMFHKLWCRIVVFTDHLGFPYRLTLPALVSVPVDFFIFLIVFIADGL